MVDTCIVVIVWSFTWCMVASRVVGNVAATETPLLDVSIGIIVQNHSREDRECRTISSIICDRNDVMIMNATIVSIPVDLQHIFHALATVQRQLKRKCNFLVLGESVQIFQGQGQQNTTFFGVDGSCDAEIQEAVIQRIQAHFQLHIFVQDTGIPRKLFQALVSVLKWKTVVLLSEPHSDIIGHVFDVMAQIHVKVLHVSLLTNATDLFLLEQIKDAYHSTIRGEMNFFVVCQYKCTERVIRLANAFDEIHNGDTALYMYSRWIVMAPGNRIRHLLNNGQNLTNLAVIEIGAQRNRENNCYHQECLLSPNRCVIYKIWTSMWSANDQRYAHLSTTYESKTDSLHQPAEIFPNIRFGFNGKMLIISTNMWPTYVYKRNDTNGVYYEGITMELLKEMSRSLNFSYQLIEPPDGEWGVVASDGTWTGLIGQLERKEIFAVFAPIGITSFREAVMDFTIPYYYDYYVVVLRLPDPSKSKWRILLTIFSWPVLLCLIASLPIMSGILCYSERVNPFYTYMYQAKAKMNPLNRFINAFWYLYGALMNQGGIHLPKSWTGRTIVIFWWLYSIMMMVTYTGNLIAFLSVTEQKAPFNTLAEMTSQNTYTWGTVGGALLVDLLKTSNRTDFRKMWQGIQRFLTDTNPEALTPNHTRQQEIMLTTPFAYISDKSGMAVTMARMCDLITIREEFFPINFAVGLQNNSPYLEMFNREMMRIQESGLIEIWRQKWWPKRDFCSLNYSSPGHVHLMDVQSVFYLFAVGIVLAIAVLVFEHLVKQYRRRNIG